MEEIGGSGDFAADHARTADLVGAATWGLGGVTAPAVPRWRLDRGPALELGAPAWAVDALARRLVGHGFFLVYPAPTQAAAPWRLVRVDPDGMDALRLWALSPGGVDVGPHRAQLRPEGWWALVLARVAWQGTPRGVDVIDLAETGWFGDQDPLELSPDDLVGRVARAGRSRARRSLVGAILSGSAPGSRDSPPGRVLMFSGGLAADRRWLVQRTQLDLARLQLDRDVGVSDAGSATERPVAGAGRRGRGPDTIEVRLLDPPGQKSEPALSASAAERAVHVVTGGWGHHDRTALVRAATGNRVSTEQVDSRPRGGWLMLSPTVPGGPVVAVDLEAAVVEELRRIHPGAVTVSRTAGALSDPNGPGASTPGVVWDGVHLPLRPESAALVVVDARRASLDVAARVARQGAPVAAIVASGKRHDYALYPHPEGLLWVTRRGWPVVGGNTAASRLRRWRARSALWRMLDRAGLAISGSGGPSVVDLVLEQLGAVTGESYELKGIITRGPDQATLRVDGRRSTLALRAALTERGAQRLANLARAQAMVRDMPGPRSFVVPKPVGSGQAVGVAWLAEEWLDARPGPGGRRWRTNGGPGWSVGREVATFLAEGASTGIAGPGWARSWGALLDDIGPAGEEISLALAELEAARVVTAWCHGDLWPGNVLLGGGGGPPVVIDWDAARPDAPAGIDAVHMEIDRLAWERHCSVGVAAAILASNGARNLDDAAVGGRNWIDWSPGVRSGLVTAAVILRASRGSVAPGGQNEPWKDEKLPPLVAALRAMR